MTPVSRTFRRPELVDPTTHGFVVPPELSAAAPPEARGVPRDGVRLLVARPGRPLRHLVFAGLPGVLRGGDLLVVNDSDTEPAALDGHRADGRPVVLHVSGPTRHGGEWVVELRTPDGRRVGDGAAGEAVRLPGGVTAFLLAAHPDPRRRTGNRLWRARIPVAGGLPQWLAAFGRPISYPYLREPRPIEDYRTLFARRDGYGFASAEMPSAARPFTPAVLCGLHRRGVEVVALTLHTGVASLEKGEEPLPERYAVPATTAAAVNATRATGGRVVAVGTTVARALETVAEPDGTVRVGAGWTDLVLSPDRPARAVDGLVTGWHEPEASHLLLLEAVAGADLVRRAYAAALARGYLWHEFGDSCAFLKATRRAR
jgi:S-adenosylmethionine:tRNA ribosyltransferase-isomerase